MFNDECLQIQLYNTLRVVYLRIPLKSRMPFFFCSNGKIKTIDMQIVPIVSCK